MLNDWRRRQETQDFQTLLQRFDLALQCHPVVISSATELREKVRNHFQEKGM